MGVVLDHDNEIESDSLGFRLSGGGSSLLRTRLCPQIPVNREIYREF
jgi:hypothetical protein